MGRRRPKRPVGWGPDAVLAWLQDNPSGTVKVLCEDIAKRCEEAVSAERIYKDITDWRKADPKGFGHSYRALVATRVAPVPQGPASYSHDAQNPDWRQQWFIAYLQPPHSYMRAAAACGMHHDTLWRKRKVGHPEFDQEFFDIWSAALEVIKEHYEDVLHWALEEAQLQGDAKTAGNLAITILERVDKARWTRAEDRRVEATVNQNVTVTLELSEGAQRAMRFAELLSNRLGLGPGPTAIDVTTRRVEAAPAPASPKRLAP